MSAFGGNLAETPRRGVSPRGAARICAGDSKLDDVRIFAFVRACLVARKLAHIASVMCGAGGDFPFGDDIHAFAGRLDTGYVIRLGRATTVTLLRSSRPRSRACAARRPGWRGRAGDGAASAGSRRRCSTRHTRCDAVTLCEPRRAQPSELT